jgi:hypothetical protein
MVAEASGSKSAVLTDMCAREGFHRRWWGSKAPGGKHMKRGGKGT